MGFLTGGYLKMYSARLRLQLQHQLTSITMRHNKIQKQVGEMERRLTQMQQSQTSVFNAQLQASNAGLYQNLFGMDKNGKLPFDPNDVAAVQMANSKYQQGQQINSVMFQQAKFQQENAFEEIRQMQLEPLQQLEESLAIEKANLETRLSTVKEQEESAKQMEKQDRKDAVADYTGQG